MQQSQINFIQIDIKARMRVADAVSVPSKQVDANSEIEVCRGNVEGGNAS